MQKFVLRNKPLVQKFDKFLSISRKNLYNSAFQGIKFHEVMSDSGWVGNGHAKSRKLRDVLFSLSWFSQNYWAKYANHFTMLGNYIPSFRNFLFRNEPICLGEGPRARGLRLGGQLQNPRRHRADGRPRHRLVRPGRRHPGPGPELVS